MKVSDQEVAWIIDTLVFRYQSRSSTEESRKRLVAEAQGAVAILRCCLPGVLAAEYERRIRTKVEAATHVYVEKCINRRVAVREFADRLFLLGDMCKRELVTNLAIWRTLTGFDDARTNDMLDGVEMVINALNVSGTDFKELCMSLGVDR